MVHVTRTFTVDRPADEVLPYLADFGHAPEWDPGTVRCTPDGPGPVAVGSTWTNVSKVMGRETTLSYRLARWDAEHVTLVGTNKTATSTDDITVRPAGSGSTITYDAKIEFHGLAVLATPIMKVEFERLGTETEKQLKAALARL